MQRWVIGVLATALCGCAPSSKGDVEMESVEARTPPPATEGPTATPSPDTRPSDDTSEQPPRPGETGDAPMPPTFEGAMIPARFHGVYAAEGRCGDAGDESRLEITSTRVGFHESSGPVLRASGEGNALTVVLRLSGEGDTRRAEYRFRREDEGRRLVDPAGGMARVRCAEKAGP